MRKITIFIIILAALVGVFGFYYYKRNIYSKGILKLEILGQETADLGQEVEYLVKYKNNGDFVLEEPRLIFEYPQYSVLEEGKSQRQEIVLEDVYPGAENTLHFKARLLGKENESKAAKAWLSYRPKNLKARYELSTTFTTVIKKVPLTFELDLPSQMESGKDFNFRINYFSNADYPLSSLQIAIEYPSGFEFIDSLPKSLEKKEWDIGLLNKAEGGRVEISGRLRGEIGEEKIFQAKIGSWVSGEFVLLKTADKAVKVAESSLYIAQQINNSPVYVASPGDMLHYEIFFKNIGETSLTNLFLVCRLEGRFFDFQTIRSSFGDFGSGDNSIVFDWKRVPELQFLDVGEEGRVEFWIKLKGAAEVSVAESPTIKNKVYLSQSKEEFVTKISSKPEISQKGYFKDEAFGNSGPLPPEVGKTTTYTITWQAKNYFSEIQNAKMKAVLPYQVNLTARIFPESESDKLSFDSQSREIVWNIGELDKGVTQNIAFQVAFTPTASQKGEVAELVGQVRFSGRDEEVERNIEVVSPAIYTNLPDDPTITQDMGRVQ